jgi:hypothetical protein
MYMHSKAVASTLFLVALLGFSLPVRAAEPVLATDISITPAGIAVDGDGNVYAIDYGKDRLLKIDAQSREVTVLATNVINMGSPAGLAVDAHSGSIFLADGATRVLVIIPSSGVVAQFAGTAGQYGEWGDGGPAFRAQLGNPFGVAVGPTGNVYIAEWMNDRVRVVDHQTGIIRTLAGNGSTEISGDGGPATEAGLPQPSSVAVDAAGNVFIAEWPYDDRSRVRRVDAVTGVITTVAGSGECGYPAPVDVALNAPLCAPYSLAVDAAGNVYVADLDWNIVRRVDVQTGMIKTVAGSGLRSSFGDGGPATEAGLDSPQHVAIDSAGNLYIADAHSYRIRRVDHATGIITTFAGNGMPSVPPHQRTVGRR